MNQYSITTAVSSTISAIESGQEIYLQIANAMDSIEEATSNLTGSEKKEWVIQYAIKEIKGVLGNLDYWLPKIKHWIDIFKTAYNALKALF